jgi:ribosome recycling factor
MEEIEMLARDQMEKTIESLKFNLNSIRTGRASASLLDTIRVDYYGEPTPLNQIASVSAPEPRQLLIKPYSRDDVKSIVAAINASNLGLAPINDGASIRLNIPALTEERRRELAKNAKKYGEDAKVAIRNVRREYMDEIKKDKDTPEDMRKNLEQCIQKATDDFVKKIDEVVAEKEKDIMTI